MHQKIMLCFNICMNSYILCLFCDCIVFTEKDWSKFDSLLEINIKIMEGKGWHFDLKIVSSKYCRFGIEMICSRIYNSVHPIPWIINCLIYSCNIIHFSSITYACVVRMWVIDTNTATKSFDFIHYVALYVYRCARFRLTSIFYWKWTGFH